MAELRIALGATADVVSSQEMQSHISGLQGHMDRTFNSLVAKKPIRRKLVAGNAVVSATIGAQTVGLLAFGDGPSIDRVWVVRSLAVFDGLNPLTTQTKNGSLCVGNASAPSVTDFVGVTWTALPFADTLNSSAVRVKANESVYVVLDSTVTGDITATMEVDEWVDSAYETQRI
jgi:hypothetical protein